MGNDAKRDHSEANAFSVAQIETRKSIEDSLMPPDGGFQVRNIEREY